MEINWDYHLLQDDIYRLHKENLRDILTEFRIKYREEDTVSELRPIVSAVKAFLKKHKTDIARRIFSKLVEGKEFLEEVELGTYTELITIQEFIAEREHLYDKIADQAGSLQVTVNQGNISIKVPEQNLIQTTSTNTGKMATEKEENLPLISAGVFNGLPTENPSDFIETYQIAAKANNWSSVSKMNLFPAHLTGTALAWFNHYNGENRINSWDILKTKFIETFTPVAQAHSLQILLDDKIQGKDQPAVNYFFDIVTICKRYDPKITDKRIIHYIIQGLQPEICERILNEDTSTLGNLEDSLRKVELQLKIRHQNKDKYDRVTRRENDDRREHIRFPRERSSDDLRGIQENIKTLTNIVANLKMGATNESQNWRGDRTDRRGRHPTNTRGAGYGQETRRYDQGRRSTSPYINQRDGSYGRQTNHQQPRGRPEERRVTFNDQGNYRGATSQPSARFTAGATRGTWRQDTQRNTAGKHCTYCKRNNHYVQECRVKRNNHSRDRYTNRFCRNCRMNNHNTEDCYRGKHYNVQKNA